MLFSALSTFIWLTAAFALHSILERDITPPNALDLTITANKGIPIPGTLYGAMFEDINHSGDGGLYGELLQNRALQAVIPHTQVALTGWVGGDGVSLSVTASTKGVSSALPNSLQADFSGYLNGPTGFHNTGYWGIKVQQGWKYTGSFYAKSDQFRGSITVSLKSTSGIVHASTTVSGISSSYKKLEFTFQPTTSAPTTDNIFTIEVDGGKATGTTIYFGLFSLFPPTYRGRPNGLRIDIAETLAATKPAVWRFPGGNNIEGTTYSTRWKWNETIGPLENRPGRVGDWGYPNTDGLGLMEYLNWVEDLNTTPILGVWSGLSTGNYSDQGNWASVAQQDLQPYVDDVVNEIEFITGDPSTNKWAALRKQLGREKPYALTYIEVGNEDNFAADTYAAYRWQMFVTTLSSKFPKLQFVATTLPTTALTPAYKKIDFHQYSTPSWFVQNQNMFDNYPRNGTQYFVGEYAVTAVEGGCVFGTLSCGRMDFPQLQGALAEAVFMTGMERNSDVVFASSYAPTLQHLQNYQWTPDLISFDAGTVLKSVSYYNQKLFGTNVGTHVLVTDPPLPGDATAPLYWVASYHDTNKVVYLKVVNVGTSDLVANLAFDFPILAGIGGATTIGSTNANISNTPDAPNAILPVDSSFAIGNPHAYNYTFTAQSITVLQLSASL